MPDTPLSPHEKAVAAINARLERLQAGMRGATGESAQRFLVQSIVVTIGVAEALNGYARAVGKFAQRRGGELKTAHAALGTQHAELLESGKAQLEKLKANPTDKELKKEIARTQAQMEGLQKTLRRDANALQRELAPSLAVIDPTAGQLRKFSEAETTADLLRVLQAVVAQVRDFYAAQKAKDVIDAAAWEKLARKEIDEAAGFQDAYARAGFHVVLGLELMALAVDENPPRSGEEAAQRSHAAVATRLKEITARLSST